MKLEIEVDEIKALIHIMSEAHQLLTDEGIRTDYNKGPAVKELERRIRSLQETGNEYFKDYFGNGPARDLVLF